MRCEEDRTRDWQEETWRVRRNSRLRRSERHAGIRGLRRERSGPDSRSEDKAIGSSRPRQTPDQPARRQTVSRRPLAAYRLTLDSAGCQHSILPRKTGLRSGLDGRIIAYYVPGILPSSELLHLITRHGLETPPGSRHLAKAVTRMLPAASPTASATGTTTVSGLNPFTCVVARYLAPSGLTASDRLGCAEFAIEVVAIPFFKSDSH